MSVPNPITQLTPQNIQNLSFDKDFGVLAMEMLGYDSVNNQLVRLAANSSGILRGLGFEFNVQDYGAKGDGITDDADAIQEAMDLAGPTGSTVRFPTTGLPYMTSKRLYVDQRSSLVSVLGPSLIGSAGRSGPSPDFGHVGGVTIKCTDDFPLGEYIIDYLGPTAQDTAVCGYKVSGIVFDCNSRGAGVRMFNSFSASWADLIIGSNPQAPNPSVAGAFAAAASNTGAFCSTGNPTQNSFYNTVDRVFVQGAAMDAFQMASGAGSFDLMNNCLSTNGGRFGYNLQQKITATSCIAQANAQTNGLSGADFNLGSYDVTLIAPVVFAGKPKYGNGIKVAGGAAAVAKVVGGTIYGPSQSGLTEQNAAIVNIESDHQNIHFIGTHFLTGTSSNTSDFVYLGAHATGSATFTSCSFLTEYGSPLTNVPVNDNGNGNVLSFENCPGINPAKAKSWGNVTNAAQDLEIGVAGGFPSGGTYTLTWGGQTTSAIPYNASAATNQAALVALSSIGAGNVVCTGGPINSLPVHVVFQGTLGNASQAAITSDASGLTGGSSPHVTITTILTGGPNITVSRVNGNFQSYVLSGNIAPTFTAGVAVGDTMTLEFGQDATGGRTIVTPSNYRKAGGTTTLSTGPNAVDLITVLWNGTYWTEISRLMNVG